MRRIAHDAAPVAPRRLLPLPPLPPLPPPLLLLLLLVAAGGARGQDTAPIATPHPLRAILTERLRTQQVLAAQRVVDARRALVHAQALAYVDTDGDGSGEFPTLAAMLGLAPWRGSPDDAAAGIMGWGRAVARGDGVVEADGYLFRVVLPNARGEPAATRGDVDADRAEKSALVLAWPVRQGISGRWTFGAHPAGIPLATKSAAYSGIGAPPDGDAFLVPRERADRAGDLSEPLPAAGEGRDGNAWRPLGEIIERLRQDEPDLAAPPGLADATGLRALVRDGWAAVLADRGRHADADASPRAPAVRMATAREIAAAIAAELRGPMERTGQWERQSAAFEMIGAATPAKYVAQDNVILVCPETFVIACHIVGIPPERMRDAFRFLIAHECAHALDFQSHPLTDALAACGDESAIAAWSAVVEGHAQQVARRIARAAGRSRAFEDLALLTSGTAGADVDASIPAVARAALAGFAFPYGDGERFMDAVLAARGTAGVAAVLDHPPTRPMAIEAPRVFLARTPRAAGVPWDTIIAPMAAFEPPSAAVRRAPMLRRTLREMLRAAPQIDADALLAALIDAESRVAVAPDGRAQAASTILLFGDAAAARAYVAASRALQQAQDAAYEANPLVAPDVAYAPPDDIDDIDAGYHARKVLRSSGGDVHGFALSVAAGRWVVEAAVTHLGKPEPGTELRVQRAVERALAVIHAR